MSCAAELYQDILTRIILFMTSCETALELYVHNRLIAYLIIAALIAPVGLLFAWSQYVLIPKIAKWYYDKTIRQQARQWFRDRGLALLGFRHSTAIISVLAGAFFYALLRAAASFPRYFLFTLPALLVVFIAIGVLGYFVSGNVPNNPKARNRYCKRFQYPTITALGVAGANIAIDFFVSLSSFTVNYMAHTF